MGRHDGTFDAARPGAKLAAGLHPSTPVLTALGWEPVAELAPGDLLMTGEAGLATIRQIRPEPRHSPWSMLLPPGVLGNESALLLPPGQPVLIETGFATPYCGEAVVLVPATALEGWRGIAPHVPPQPESVLQVHLDHPGVIFAGPGLLAWVPGTDDRPFDPMRLLQEPARPVLPLAAARQLVARLIADEAGGSPDRAQAAAFRPPNRS
jgi:hypothetical protein